MQLTEYNTLLVKAYATAGHTPKSIAMLLGYTGEFSNQFIEALKNPETELFKVYHEGLAEATNDVEVALQKKAVEGDVFAIVTQSELRHKKSIDQMKNEFFGL